MAYFKRTRFSGIAPAIGPKLLGDQFAQVAQNIDFERGNLKPAKENGAADHTVTGVKRSIYSYDFKWADEPEEAWLEWVNDYVKAVPGPIPGDTDFRLYWTGDGTPKYGTLSKILGSKGISYDYPIPSQSFDLGVPAPATAPTVQIQGEQDPDVDPVEEYAWVYTYVTAYGEEGPPSKASLLYAFTPTTNTEANPVASFQTAQVTCIGSYEGNVAMGVGAKIRLYRSNTGSQLTFFQYVDEKPYGQTVIFYDDLQDAQLGEVLPSDTWIGPPNGPNSTYPDGSLQGLIPVANGVMAGHVGKRLCMSEPYLPHAWPIGNRITLERDIVAIGTTANGIVALTDGKPYFVTGVEPAAMTAITIDLAQACTNKFSVVDMGEYLLYCGPDGLCAVSGGEGKVVTKGLINVDDWRDNYFPDRCKAFLWEGVYVACDPEDRIAWVYDPRAAEAALSWTDGVTKDGSQVEKLFGGYTKLKDGQLYLIDSRKLVPFQAGDTNKIAKWRSKIFVAEAHTSMAWLSVGADWVDGVPVKATVYVDDALLFDATFTVTTRADKSKIWKVEVVTYDAFGVPATSGTNGSSAEPTTRMPPYAGKHFEIEIESNIEVDEVCIASTMDEIRGA